MTATSGKQGYNTFNFNQSPQNMGSAYTAGDRASHMRRNSKQRSHSSSNNAVVQGGSHNNLAFQSGSRQNSQGGYEQMMVTNKQQLAHGRNNSSDIQGREMNKEQRMQAAENAISDPYYTRNEEEQPVVYGGQMSQSYRNVGMAAKHNHSMG